MEKLSIAGKNLDTKEQVFGYYYVGDRMKVWGQLGAFWGSLWGILLGSAFFFIPGIGHILVGGPLVHIIISGLEGAVIVGGVSALSAGLLSLGIPKDSILNYEAALKSDQYLLIAHGSVDEVNKARKIFAGFKAQEVVVYHN